MAKRSPARVKPRGRPPKRADLRKRNTVTMRLRDDTKTMLEAAAKVRSRSLSAEIEARVEQSLYSIEQGFELAYGKRLAGLILVVARAMHDTGTSEGFRKTFTLDGSVNWLREPWAYQQAMNAANTIFECFRPEGEAVPPRVASDPRRDEGLEDFLANPGRAWAAGLIQAIAGHGATGELQEWAIRRRDQLGELANTAERSNG